MEQEVRSNLKISGAGSAGGGKYYEVSINGAGKIDGDIDCIVFSCNGAGSVYGNIKSKTSSINGAGKLEGNLDCEEITVNGSCEIAGDVKSGKIKINGSSHIRGDLHSSEVDLRGNMDLNKDCEAENFKSTGCFKIDGLLNAGDVSVKLFGNCRVREIGCEKIDVKRADGIGFAFQRVIKDLFNFRDSLVTETIEGDDIYLESTIAKVVRGNNVTIGPDCSIDLIEYKDSVNVSPSSRVKEQVKA